MTIRVAVAAIALVVASAQAADEPYNALPYTPSLDVAAMDRSIDPCVDLYAYACGGWQKHNPIPADETGWSVYGKLYVDNQRYLWGILQDAARPDASRNANQQRIGDYFAACMDEEGIQRAGLAPLREELQRIDAVRDRRSLAALVGRWHSQLSAGNAFFNSGSQQDTQEAERVIAGIYAGGLGLPDRDYYVENDAKSVEIRVRYLAHVASMLVLLGEDSNRAQLDARAVLRIETALAKASLTQVEQRDPYKTYHRETLASLTSMAAGFDWRLYFAVSGLTVEPWINVAEPAFFRELSARLAGEPLPDLRSYLRWALVASSAPYLSRAFVAESFAFNRAYLRGAERDKPRWKKCVGLVDQHLGEALGKEFVTRAFPQEMKTSAVRMTRQIEVAMQKRIEALDWMSFETKKQALTKLAAMRDKVGYPDLWRDYSALSVTRADFFGNVVRAVEFERRRDAGKIGKPVDRTEWSMSPPTVNAYYNPQTNDINFPAGVLLPPLYDPKMDDAPNYGNTGGTIGHELTHGFDDQGRQYDAQGNLRNWWSSRDAAEFEQRAQCVRDQYSQYTIVDDIKINGALTAGEDIADLGGMLLAWMAWQEQTQAMKLEDRDGLSAEQRFFVGFAQWACANQRPENLRVNAITDPHSPPGYRINGVVANMPQFAKAFRCKAGQPLVKSSTQLCTIW